jgi:hypothetical protein
MFHFDYSPITQTSRLRGAVDGGNLEIYANEGTYPNISMSNDAEINIVTGTDIVLYENATQFMRFQYDGGKGVINTDNANIDLVLASDADIYMREVGTDMFKFSYTSPDSYLYGASTTLDDLLIYSNTIDNYPYIQLAGSGSVDIYSRSHIQFFEGPTTRFKFSNVNTASAFYGSDDTTDDLLIYANTADAYPYIQLAGSGNILLSGSKICVSSQLQAHTISCAVYQGPSPGGGATTLDELTDTSLTTPASGEVLIYKKDNARWENELPSMTFNLANVRLISGQNLNITRFDAGSKNVYVWQAAACNSGGVSTGDLSIELLSGSTSVYSTSSASIQQGYPLAKSDGGDTEIRFKYSSTSGYGQEENQMVYGTCFMQISVY